MYFTVRHFSVEVWHLLYRQFGLSPEKIFGEKSTFIMPFSIYYFQLMTIILHLQCLLSLTALFCMQCFLCGFTGTNKSGIFVLWLKYFWKLPSSHFYRPAIVVLLMSMVNEKQPFVLRCAVLYCFQSFLYKNEVGQSQIIQTLLPTSADG